MKRRPVTTSRRRFLGQSIAAIGFPSIIPASVLGQNAPSNRVTMGVVGWGMMGPGNTRSFLGQADCQVVAACDIDQRHREAAVNTINEHYKNKDCKAYHDFRELMARADIDTVMLALPDNWHGVVSVEAAKNGKDIYGEKPLARTIAEQQAIVAAVQKHGRIWQTGSWQRSEDNFRIGAEIVRNGLIGKLTRVEVGLPAGHNDFAKTGDKTQITEPPAHLDYDMWIGPSRMEPYIEARIHKNWRWNYNIGGGQLLDWIGHHCDIAHWGMDMDNGGPLEVSPVQVDMPPPDAVWNTATKYRADCLYPDGVVMVIAGGHPDIRGGTKWIGAEGWLHVNRGGSYDCSIPELREVIKKREGDQVVEAARAPKLGDDVIKQRLYNSPGHHRNFLDCVKSRQPTVTPVETAHHSAIPGHLALISLMLGRKVKWDAAKEQIHDDDEAAKMLGREMRGDWKLS
jgi:predicted dehydrogenase